MGHGFGNLEGFLEVVIHLIRVLSVHFMKTMGPKNKTPTHSDETPTYSDETPTCFD